MSKDQQQDWGGENPTILKLDSLSRDFSMSRSKFLSLHYKPGMILDLGNLGGVYGGGASNSFNQEFRKRVATDSKVYGFDLFAPPNPTDYPDQERGDINDGLPYADRFFDTVYMGQLLEHLENPGKALREVHRVLKDDGVFILDTPNAYNLKRYLRYLLKKEEHLGDPTHLILFTPGSLRALLMRAGFSLEHFTMKYSAWSRWLGFFFVAARGAGSTSILSARKKL